MQDYNGEYIQEIPNIFRDCNESEITLKKLIRLVHNSTEDLDIRIVSGGRATDGISPRIIPDYLETDVYGDYKYCEENPKVQRILRYYGGCPCWNLVAKLKRDGKGVYPCLEVHIHFRDIRASWLQEREDKKKEKSRKYRHKG